MSPAGPTAPRGQPADPATWIHLVRHATVHNPRGVFYGRLPGFGLSEAGRAQAREAARALEELPLAAVYASPRLRARQTAREIARGHPGLTVRVSSLLDEVLTPFQGRPLAELHAAGEDVYAGAGPGFEQPGDVAERMGRFLRRMCRRHPGGHVAAVTHGDPIVWAVIAGFGGRLDPKRKARLQPYGIRDGYPAPASVTTLRIREPWGPDGLEVAYQPTGERIGV
ncbi:MAG: hypothetical protein Kow0092_28100 [Deferrisomatales bacterium]